MANRLYNSMNTNPLEQIAQQAREFKKQFSGNPRQEVERLLQSGQMTQQQFNQYSQIARQVSQLMGKR